MFDTNPEVQELHRQLRNLQLDFDVNEVDIQEAYKYVYPVDDMKRLFVRKDKLQKAIYRLKNRIDSFYE